MTARALLLAAFGLLLAAASHGRPTRSARRLQQDAPIAMPGKIILIDRTRTDRTSETIAMLRRPNGRRIRLRVGDAALQRLRSGMKANVRGGWAVAPGGAGRWRGDSDDPRQLINPVFRADNVEDVGPPVQAPKPVETPFVEPTEWPIDQWAQELGLPPGGGGGDGGSSGGGDGGSGGRRRLQQLKVLPTLITNPLIASTLKVLFIPMQNLLSNGSACAGTQKPLLTAAQVRTAVFSELNDNTTVSSLYNDCSFNKTMLTMDTSTVVNTVTLPCSGSSWGIKWSAATCNFDDFSGWSDAADQVLIDRGVDLSRWDYRVYLMPPNTCGWVGQGYIGCDGSYDCRAWVSGGFWDAPQPVAHELGHNLFMQHAGYMSPSGAYDEYGDTTCVMGTCCDSRCWNAPHAWQMGWTAARQLNGTTLPIGATYNTTLGAQSVSPGLSTIRIVPTWAPTVDPVFMSYRYPGRGDSDLAASLSRRVHIYSSKVAGTWDPQRTDWRYWLRTNETYVFSAANLVITRTASTAPHVAVVTICRRGGLFETQASCQNDVDWNCDGLSGPDDPACQAWGIGRR